MQTIGNTQPSNKQLKALKSVLPGSCPEKSDLEAIRDELFKRADGWGDTSHAVQVALLEVAHAIDARLRG